MLKDNINLRISRAGRLISRRRNLEYLSGGELVEAHEHLGDLGAGGGAGGIEPRVAGAGDDAVLTAQPMASLAQELTLLAS